MTQLKLNRRLMTWMTWVLVVVWPGVIFFLSSQPTWTGSQEWMQLDFIRDLAHVVVFFVLTAVLWKGMEYAPRISARLQQVAVNRSRIAFIFSFIYGVTDEIHQYYVPGRSSSLKDVALDTLGALLALGLLRMWQRRDVVIATAQELLESWMPEWQPATLPVMVSDN